MTGRFFVALYPFTIYTMGQEHILSLIHWHKWNKALIDMETQSLKSSLALILSQNDNTFDFSF